MENKKCSKCKLIKPIIEFLRYKSGKNVGRYFSYCKSCHAIYRKKWEQNNRWLHHYEMARYRCNAINGAYYGRIKFFITSKEVKYLWFRDKAYLLKHPSIDRIDNNGNYTLENCRFIELGENARRGRLGTIPWNKGTKGLMPKHRNSKKPFLGDKKDKNHKNWCSKHQIVHYITIYKSCRFPNQKIRVPNGTIGD